MAIWMGKVAINQSHPRVWSSRNQPFSPRLEAENSLLATEVPFGDGFVSKNIWCAHPQFMAILRWWTDWMGGKPCLNETSLKALALFPSTSDSFGRRVTPSLLPERSQYVPRHGVAGPRAQWHLSCQHGQHFTIFKTFDRMGEFYQLPRKSLGSVSSSSSSPSVSVGQTTPAQPLSKVSHFGPKIETRFLLFWPQMVPALRFGCCALWVLGPRDDLRSGKQSGLVAWNGRFLSLVLWEVGTTYKAVNLWIHSAGGSNFAPQPQPISLRACLAQEDGAWSLYLCGPTSAGRAIAPRNVVCPGCTNAGKDEGKGLWPASQKWDPKKYTKLVV